MTRLPAPLSPSCTTPTAPALLLALGLVLAHCPAGATEPPALVPPADDAASLPAAPPPDAEAPQQPPAIDPCLSNASRQGPDGDASDAFDWTRDWLYRSVCGSAYWFDSFFGEERFDDAARGLRGHAFLIAERRQGHGLKFKPGLRVRVPFPNISRRFDLFFDRDDEQSTIEGRNEALNNAALADTSLPGGAESSQVGFAYRVWQEIDELLNFRVGVRLRSAQLHPFVQGRYRKDFWKTDTTQWHFTETIFWRRNDGFGQTTAVDFDAALTPTVLFRWFNNATLSEATDAFAWQTGVSLYKNLGDARAVQGVLTAVGETGSPVAVGNYEVRASYRQTLGRPWLLGELFTGVDWPRAVDDSQRRREAFGGMRLEIHFGH